MTQAKKRFEGWRSKYCWDKCGLNNGEYGNYLSSYLRNQKTPLVLNLNSPWGTGKTHFLKQLYVDLRYKNNYPTVYINAWESDFTNDPLLVIISELLEQLNSIHHGYSGVTESLHKNLGKLAKRGWNGFVDIGAAYVSTKQDDLDYSILQNLTQHIKFDQQSEPKLGRTLADNYRKQLAAIKDTHACLSAYVESFPETSRKVFVLVDELDRCRPTYSIEMLETIKHFFSMENYVFVVATDTSALSHSIRAVYGTTFDGKEYLSRFFNRSAALPESDRRLFAKLLVDKSMLAEQVSKLIIFDGTSPIIESISTMLYEVGVLYDLSLRRLEQLFSKVEAAILYELETENRLFDIRLLIQLVAEYDSVEFRGLYDLRKRAIGMTYKISKATKDKMGYNVASIEQMLIIANGHKLNHAKEVQINYSFSWKFANLFSDKQINGKQTVKDGLNELNEQRNKKSEQRTTIGPNYNSDTQQLKCYFETFQCLCESGHDSRGLWSRDDYFKAVELTSSINTIVDDSD